MPDVETLNLLGTVIGAATVSATVAVSCILWITNKFEKHEIIANVRHEENLERFKDIAVALARLEK